MPIYDECEDGYLGNAPKEPAANKACLRSSITRSITWLASLEVIIYLIEH